MTGMTVIVKTITRWTAALIFLYGAYMVLYGHLSVGGGFAGGIILACSYVIMILAYGGKETIHALPKTIAARLDSVGSLAFLILACIGMFCGGGYFFFSNWLRDIWKGEDFHVFSAGIIPLANVAIALKVCVSLFLIFFILASLRMTRKGQEIEFHSEEED